MPRSAIIARLGIIGDGMCEKIEVLGLQLDGFTAKEAMQEAQACPDGASHCGRPDAFGAFRD